MALNEYDMNSYKIDVTAAFEYMNGVINLIKSDHQAGIDNDSEATYTRAKAKKNQQISAAGKRLRVGATLRLLDDLDKDFDLTTILATKITERFLGRAIDRKILMDRYGTKGRTAANKSEDYKRLDEICASPKFVAARKRLDQNLIDATELRKKIFESYKNKK
jgi:hypothetical protein